MIFISKRLTRLNSLPLIPKMFCPYFFLLSRLNQTICKRLLNKLGYDNVHVADNGLEATEMCAKQPFSLILMDIHVWGLAFALLAFRLCLV